MACHSLCAVSGMSSGGTPSGRSAFITALVSVASDAVQPDSPMPFTPNGLMVPKVVCSAMVMSLI